MATALETPQDVFDWLLRRRSDGDEGADDDVSLDALQRVLRTAIPGVVPLQGSAVDVAAPSTFGSKQALTAAKKNEEENGGDDKDKKKKEEPEEEEEEETLVAAIAACCALPAAVGRAQQRDALRRFAVDTLQLSLRPLPATNNASSASDDDVGSAWWSRVHRVRRAYFAARHAYFSARIELLRCAIERPRDQDASSVVAQVVAQWTRDGLVHALVEELRGRRASLPGDSVYNDLGELLAAPAVEHWLRVAQHEREQQLLHEELLLRELLLLALHVTHERLSLTQSMELVELLLEWPHDVVPQVFSQQSLATPTFRQRLGRVHALSAVLCLRLVHVCSLQDTCAADVASEWNAISTWTRNYLLAGAWRSSDEATDAFTGVVLLAWATLLARVYRSPPSSLYRSQCESDLRDVLAAAESLSAFQQLRCLLGCLVFDQVIDDNDDGAAKLATASGGSVPSRTSWSLVGWELPSVDEITQSSTSNSKSDKAAVAVFQLVAASFLDDALSVLGYVDALTSVDGASAMVKLLVPVLENATVARLVLDGTRSVTSALDAAPSSVGGAISEIVDASTRLWPQHALPGLRLHTALSLALPRDGTDATLHALSLPRRLRDEDEEDEDEDDGMRDERDDGRTWRAMPPDHYVDVRDDVFVVCKQSFVYEDDGFVVRTGAEGTLRVVVVAHETIEQVHWRHDTTRATPPTLSVLDVLVDDVEQHNIESLTALFEWITSSSSTALANALREWALARLRGWWRVQQLPGRASELPMRLAREHDVSLSRLLAASREDLVEWGVSDRNLRECLLSRAGSTSNTASTTTHRRSHHSHHRRQKGALVRDAAGHILRLAIDVLEHYVGHNLELDENEANEAMLTTSALVALRLLPRVLALDTAVDTLVTELSVERVHRVVVQATRKLFELHESALGAYDGVAATTETMLRVARWFVARDARRLTSSAAGSSHSMMQDDHEDDESLEREQQRQWLVATVEYVLDVLATHETWRFERLQDKWALVDRCLRVLATLLTARGFHDAASFQRALRDAVVSDAALLMKVLRSCARLLTSSNENSSTVAVARLYPFEWVLKSESSLPARERLAVTALRLVDTLCMTYSDDEKNERETDIVDVTVAAMLLRHPIDAGDGLPAIARCDPPRQSLNLVQLCAGYLGYTSSPTVVAASLKILHTAASVVGAGDGTQGDNEMMIEGASTGGNGAIGGRSLVSLFPSTEDLVTVRAALLRILRQSSSASSTSSAGSSFSASSSAAVWRRRLRLETLSLLTRCLDRQPGFFAYVLFDEEKTAENDETESSSKKSLSVDGFVSLITQFLARSERLLDDASEELCAVLQFLRDVFFGSLVRGRRLHSRIAQALRQRAAPFWGDLSRVLRVRLPAPLEHDDDMDNDMDGDDDAFIRDSLASAPSLTGRSGVYGLLSRALVLEILGLEWHYKAAPREQGESEGEQQHALQTVLDEFREEGVFAHWLRTLPHLDYHAARVASLAEPIASLCVPCPTLVSPSHEITTIAMRFADATTRRSSVVAWQLGGQTQLQASNAVARRTSWTHRTLAHAVAQLVTMVKWKELMQLLALQHGSSSMARKQSSDVTSPLVPTSPGRNKRKESMIAPSPKRRHNSDDDDNASNGLQSSPSATKTSNFFGDRTSFWIVQTLADELARAAQRGPGGMDVVALQHTRHALALLVAMLHHQFCVVVRKTRDPKLAKTQYRLEAPASASAGAPRLSAAKSLELLTLLEQVMRLVLAAAATAAGEDAAATTASEVDNWRGESVLALWQHLSPTFAADYRALLAEVRLSLATAALLLTRHVVSLCGSTSPQSLATELVQRAIVVQVKWVEHAMTSMHQSEESDNDDGKSNSLFSVSWSLFQELLGEFTSVTSSAKRKDTALQSLDPIVTLRPFTILLQHDRHGFSTLMAFVVRRFRAYNKVLENSTGSSLSSSSSSSLAEACNILRGLQSLVWNPTTSELCRSVLVSQDDSPSRFSLLRFFAKTLVPLLSEILDRELQVSASFLDGPPLRGYCVSSTPSGTAFTTATTTSKIDDAATQCRSPAHEAWCLVLEIAAGLTRSSSSVPVFAGPNFDAVWEFLASAERLLALSLSPTTRFTRAFVDEQRSALSFLHALSAGNKSARRKQWREMFPRSFVVLMEQSRQVLRRACVLLGNSSFSASRKREQQQQLQKKSRRLSVTAWPLHSPRVSMTAMATATSPSAASSPSSSSSAAAAGVSFAQQTLLHEHLQPATTDDRKQLVAFYRDMEHALVGVVQQASALLLPWTASIVARDASVSVDGTRMIDDERLIPLLSLEAPDDALTMGSDPSVGQLCAAMDYFVDQLQRGRERATPQSQREQPVLANALNTCGLLFLKTFLLHATLLEDAQPVKTVMTELKSYFGQLNDQLSLLEPSQAHGVAHEMFRQIEETVATEC